MFHSNLAERLPNGMDGVVYSFTFLDHHSRFKHSPDILLKSDSVQASDQYNSLPHEQKYFPKGIELLHGDGDGEYSNVDVKEHSETTPHTTYSTQYVL